MNTYIETLKQEEQLSDIELFAVEQFRPFLQTWKISKNEYLFKQGDFLDISFMVEKGLIRLFSEDENGKEKTLQFLKEKDFFDDCNSYFENTPINYNLQALEDTVISYFPMSKLEEMAVDYPALNSIGRNINYQSMQDHRKHLELLMEKSPDERYRQLQINKPYLIQRVSVTHLAQYLDMSRECLSRIRSKKLVRQ
jgi:CRP-like cAMP-binding protein